MARGTRPAQPHGAPRSLCLNSLPRINVDGGQEIIQKQGMVIIVSTMGWHRVIYTDGRPAIGGDAKFWFGNSRGRWEGDTLVVEVTGNNGRGWFDTAGNFYTPNTKFTERWRLADANTIDYEVTIEDPSIYTRPWKLNFPKRRPGYRPEQSWRPSRRDVRLAVSGGQRSVRREVWEEACFEGNHREHDHATRTRLQVVDSNRAAREVSHAISIRLGAVQTGLPT